jgi:hypothetical protein
LTLFLKIRSDLPAVRVCDAALNRRYFVHCHRNPVHRLPAAADPLQHLDFANTAGLMLVLASDVDEQLTVNAQRSP